MKTRKWGKTILALLLAMLMILPSLAAIAEEAETFEKKIMVEHGVVYVADPETYNWVEDPDLTESKKLEGDLTISVEKVSEEDEDSFYGTALSVYSSEAEDEGSSFEVTGAVTAEVEHKLEESLPGYYADATASGVSVDTFGDASAQVTIGEGITASAEANGDWAYANAYGIATEIWVGGEINVSIGGDVNATAKVNDDTKEGEDKNGATANAVRANVHDGGETIIEIDGNATADATAPEGQATAGAVTVNYHGGDGGGFLPVGPLDTLSGDGADGGEEQEEEVIPTDIQITVHGDASATADVGDRHDTEYPSQATASAVAAGVSEGQTVEVTVDGDASAEATNEGDGNAQAITVAAIVEGDDAEATFTVTGDVVATATGNDYANAAGIYVMASGENETDITVGSITATATAESKEDEEEEAAAEDEEAEPEVKSEATGVVVMATDGATVNITVGEGGIEATGDQAIGAGLIAGDGAAITLSVDGDVTADTYGLGLMTVDEEESEASSTVDALVTGTVSGDTAAVVIGSETTDNMTLTIWKANLNDDGAVVIGPDYTEQKKGLEEEMKAAEEAEDDEWIADVQERMDIIEESEEKAAAAAAELEKNILYIIKVEQPTAGGTLQATDKDGNALAKSHDYDVAKEGEKVLLKVNVTEGYKVTGAYNGDGEKIPLLVDEAGNYYVEVVKGGGVYLSAKFEKLPDPEPQPQPEPEPEKKYSVATPILTVTAVDNDKVEIRFYKSGNFVVTLENGDKERGTYAFENGQLVLNCESGKVEVTADEEFTYTSVQKSLSHQFKLSQAEIDTLKGN